MSSRKRVGFAAILLLQRLSCTTWDTSVGPESPAAKLGILPIVLKDAGLPADIPWRAARDAAILNNPSGPKNSNQ